MVFNTPFGNVDSVIKAFAPTKEEVAKNPGLYEGTSFDPFKIVIPQGIFSRFSDDPDSDTWVLPTLNDWFLKDKLGALKYFKNQFGFDLNTENLTNSKKKELGL